MVNKTILELENIPLGESVVKNETDQRKEYELAVQGVEPEEKKHFMKWWISFQDLVTWEDFKKKGYQHLSNVVEEVHEHILKAQGKPEQLKLAFMPKEIARTSPFFPMKRADMSNRPLYKDFVIENRWGTITVSGPKLSINDESVLLAVLFLAKKHRTERFETDYNEICGIMGVSRGTTQYTAIAEGLERLASSIVNTKLYETENLEKREIARSITGAILSNVDQTPKSTKVSVFLNPYFLALYGANMTTGLNLDKRAKLKGDVAKALYRFLETHSGGGVPFGLITLCNAVNLNTDQPKAEIRKVVRKSLAELQKQGNIKRWKIDKKDLVHIFR